METAQRYRLNRIEQRRRRCLNKVYAALITVTLCSRLIGNKIPAIRFAPD